MSTELVVTLATGGVLAYLASRYGIVGRILDAVCEARAKSKADKQADEPGEGSTEEETVSS